MNVFSSTRDLPIQALSRSFPIGIKTVKVPYSSTRLALAGPMAPKNPFATLEAVGDKEIVTASKVPAAEKSVDSSASSQDG
jgi:hypothetical protein